VSFGAFALMIMPEAPTKGRIVCASVLALIAAVRLRGLCRNHYWRASDTTDRPAHTRISGKFGNKLTADELRTLKLTMDGWVRAAL
jgi:hypothetical protein